MALKELNCVDSPLLDKEEVDEFLIQLNGKAAELGHNLSMSAQGLPQLGSSGTSKSATWAARKFQKLDGSYQVFQVPRTDSNLERVGNDFFQGECQYSEGADPETGEEAGLFFGVVGVGMGGLHPCMVQMIWTDTELRVTVHAKEGYIKQKACLKALKRLQETLGA